MTAPTVPPAPVSPVVAAWRRFRAVAMDPGVPEWSREYRDAEIAYEHALAGVRMERR